MQLRYFPLSILVIACFQVFAQTGNVGIGTTSPSAKLSVEGSDVTLDGQGAAIKIRNTSSTNAWYLRAGGGSGTNTPFGGFSIADNSAYHFNINSSGSVGLGILPTAARLHVNGDTRLQGNSVLEFGAGIAGKEINAGKIGYNAFGSNALEIVGAGKAVNARSVYLFAEGGTNMNGPLGFNGALRVNGNAGSEGQVLTSNGTAAPSWRNTSLSNNVRFAASYNINFSASISAEQNTFTTTYNLEPASVTIGTNSITVNKSGLYHIEGYVERGINFSGPPQFLDTDFSLVLGGIVIEYEGTVPLLRNFGNSSSVSYSKTTHFSYEIYIPSPGVIRPVTRINFNAGTATLLSRFGSGVLTGYLISE